MFMMVVESIAVGLSLRRVIPMLQGTVRGNEGNDRSEVCQRADAMKYSKLRIHGFHFIRDLCGNKRKVGTTVSLSYAEPSAFSSLSFWRCDISMNVLDIKC
jgi:hypothetical protein